MRKVSTNPENASFHFVLVDDWTSWTKTFLLSLLLNRLSLAPGKKTFLCSSIFIPSLHWKREICGIEQKKSLNVDETQIFSMILDKKLYN